MISPSIDLHKLDWYRLFIVAGDYKILSSFPAKSLRNIVIIVITLIMLGHILLFPSNHHHNQVSEYLVSLCFVSSLRCIGITVI